MDQGSIDQAPDARPGEPANEHKSAEGGAPWMAPNRLVRLVTPLIARHIGARASDPAIEAALGEDARQL